MPNSSRGPCPMHQDGVALAVALILLVIITLLGLSAVRLSSMELRMSGNDELRVSSFETAGSLVDAAISLANNTPPIFPGTRMCVRTGSLVPACTTTGVTLPTEIPPGAAVNYQDDTDLNVEITGITGSNSPPTGSGWGKDYAAANLKISGIYDRNIYGSGRATVSEGLSVIYPLTGQRNFGGGKSMQSEVP
jgi:Tfp pilus assembly protein PilX